MALIASAEGGQSFKPIEEGAYAALCCGLIDCGDEYGEKFDKVSRKCLLMWELDGVIYEDEDGQHNRTISKTYTLSLNDKSSLRKDLRAWRGREFTDEELKRFDLKNILGAPCQLQIVHSKKGEKVYADISGIMSLPRTMPKPSGTQTPVYWDFEENEIGDGVWLMIPEWVRKRIEASETYQYITQGQPGHLTDQRIEEIQTYKSYTAFRADNTVTDADIPF